MLPRVPATRTKIFAQPLTAVHPLTATTGSSATARNRVLGASADPGRVHARRANSAMNPPTAASPAATTATAATDCTATVQRSASMASADRLRGHVCLAKSATNQQIVATIARQTMTVMTGSFATVRRPAYRGCASRERTLALKGKRVARTAINAHPDRPACS